MGKSREDKQMQSARGKHWTNGLQAPETGDFYLLLSPEAMNYCQLLEIPSACPANTILFRENETPSTIFVLLEGEVRLTTHSSNGRQGRVAKPGEILDVASALSGCPHEMTAETLVPCKIASIRQQNFLQFLSACASAYQCVASDMSFDCDRAGDQPWTTYPFPTAASAPRLTLEC
jgi:hypothetical protein